MRTWLALPARITVVTVLLAAAAYFVPTPYILRAPGHADDLASIVHVQGGRASQNGRLLMTTIIYEEANLLFCFYSMFDSRAMLVPDDEVVVMKPPPHGAPLPFPRITEDVMAHSKDVARVVALRRTGYDIRVESTGVRILGFLPNAPAASWLRLDDVIDSVDGVRVRSVLGMRDALRKRAPGQQATVRYRRAGQAGEARFALVDHGGRALVGIVGQDAMEHGRLPLEIDIRTPNVNGASAGLMFTLAIIDQLTSGKLARGHVIAGTGTIALDETVGAIEGVDLKLVAAQRAGATVFLVPQENYPEIRGRAPEIKIIPIRTLDDALDALKALP